MPGSVSQSRRKTPWDCKKDEELTATQAFLKKTYNIHYKERHPNIIESGEYKVINEHIPSKCPACGSTGIVKRGLTRNLVQRYKCKCGATFLPTTGTIFDEHRIAISEWIEYCLNLFRYVSVNADSWNNKNAFTTSKYWLAKVFLTLEGYQDTYTLGNRVWLDETYYPVVFSELETNGEGHRLAGLSRNQICIGCAVDGERCVCVMEGLGKPTMEKSFNAFKDRIERGSELIHDREKTHRRLVEHLCLTSTSYSSKELKRLPDKENPLDPVNNIHYMLKRFLDAHSGFSRKELDGYLNLYAFTHNPPHDPLEKVEMLLNMAFDNPRKLRYRSYYRAKSNSENGSQDSSLKGNPSENLVK